MADSQTPRRPDYSALDLPLPDDDANTDVQEVSQNARGQASANTQTLLAQSNGGPSQTPAQPAPTQSYSVKDRTVFTAPEGQTVSFAAEIPGGIKGVSDKDSYLFITQDKNLAGVLTFKGWRAFVVPKDEPHNQRELSLAVDFDPIHDPLNRHELHAKLGQDHDLVVGDGYTSIDTKSMKHIASEDTISGLVKQRMLFAGNWTDANQTEVYHSGESWVVIKKDFDSGRIERFTQSGTGALGRLEVIQGDPASANQPVTAEQRARGESIHDGRFDWKQNDETKRQPVSSSNTLVPLPDGMKKDVAGYLGDVRTYQGRPDWINQRMATALETLAHADAVKPGARQENTQLAAQAPTRNNPPPPTRNIAPAAHL